MNHHEHYHWPLSFWRHYGDGDLVQGFKAWLRDGRPIAFEDDADDESRARFNRVGLWWLRLSSTYKPHGGVCMDAQGRVYDQEHCLKAHELCHGPLGADKPMYRFEGRGRDGGLRHAPQGSGDVMQPRQPWTTDTRCLNQYYDELDDAGRIRRHYD